MQTRPSLILLALIPCVATVTFMGVRRTPLGFWLDAWPILPFIATALGILFIVVKDHDERRVSNPGA
jgi:hypothetical protein